VVHGDGFGAPLEPADGLYVNAGATHPPAAWLDALAPGGRLLLPLTTDEGWRRFDVAEIARRGAVFLIARARHGYRARCLSAPARVTPPAAPPRAPPIPAPAPARPPPTRRCGARSSAADGSACGGCIGKRRCRSGGAG